MCSAVGLEVQCCLVNGIQSGSEIIRFQKLEKTALYSFLCLQILHSVLFLFTGVLNFIRFGHRQNYLESVLASAICVAVAAKCFRKINQCLSWTYVSVGLIALDVLAYTFWFWTHEDEWAKVILSGQLALVPAILIVWGKAIRRLQIRAIDAGLAFCAVLISASFVMLRARYFPLNEVDWAIVPTFYFERLVYSNFHWPQENSLALLLMSYFGLAAFYRTLFGSRGKT
jgi:hypothetical protein